MKYEELIKYNYAHVEIDTGVSKLEGDFCIDTKNKNYVLLDVPVYDYDIGTDYCEVKLNIRKIKSIKEVD